MLKRLFTLLTAAFLLASCAVGASAFTIDGSETGVVTYRAEEGFEDYNEGIICSATAEEQNIMSGEVKNKDGVSISDIWGFQNIKQANSFFSLEEVERDGAPTKAIRMEIGETNTLNNVKFWPKIPASADAKKRYYIVKADIKNGSDNSNGFDWLSYQGTLKIQKTQAIRLTNGTVPIPIKPFDWNEYIFITDIKTGELKFVVNGEIAEESLTNDSYKTFGYVTGMGFIHYYDPVKQKVAWFDNVAVYGADTLESVFESSNPANGVTGAAQTDEIKLNFSGASVDEDSLQNITVTAGGSPAEIKSVTCENNVCTIRLSEKMEAFTEYAVDFSKVSSEFGIEIGEEKGKLTFTTTGPVQLSIAADFSRITDSGNLAVSALQNGMIEAEITVDNTFISDVNSLTVVAALKKGGELQALSHDVFPLTKNAKKTMRAAFLITDAENESIEIYVKDSLNGTYYYSDVITVSKAGIVKKEQEETEERRPVINHAPQAADKVTFHKLVLGENGSRTDSETLSAGLAECRAGVSAAAGETPVVIAQLKKNGQTVALSYLQKETADGVNGYSLAVNVPEGEGYTLDVFAWEDFSGSGSRFAKTTLS